MKQQTPLVASNLRSRVQTHLLESAEVKRQIVQQCTDSILLTAQILAETFRNGGKVLLCGNGGSAADCQHMAGELVNYLTKDFLRPGLAAIALTTDSSLFSAIANDCGLEHVFERQVQTLGRPGDALLGISTSGNSLNVIRAIEAAQALDMRTIGLTGGNGGKLADLAEVVIAVPSSNTQYIQEGHLAIEHILCELVEKQLFGEIQA
ncbi:D-sedoheptulose 7-phosphate isomerase [Kovacikia minuta CCNUW1]|uniref:D-sedoheptulose-7-phosphate isomerase n=1 Tax=Kovacikia minuta TaxID=2931930 RepID=UPI001CCE9763|nr:D-sedoheptulose 7-phosphate isomerase [Kovacikia minuta]UBF26008.1 D-sedoheptulose 7-phosphate isomerase [Kovacikia minuta CCNUW1]